MICDVSMFVKQRYYLSWNKIHDDYDFVIIFKYLPGKYLFSLLKDHVPY